MSHRIAKTLVVAFALVLGSRAEAQGALPPAVPANLQVPPGINAFLKGHAAGTQDYVCLPSGSGAAWTFFGPQATLFSDDANQITTHFLSSNPYENDTPRATWRDSRDTSTIWALAVATSTDRSYVAAGAIPWLLLQVVGAEEGPTRGQRLAGTVYIQRLNTAGGMAPTSGCASMADVGKKALVPYSADYFFYRIELGRVGRDRH